MAGKVIVIINPKSGEITYEVENMSGQSCEELTKAILLNNEVVESRYKDSYYIPDTLPDYINTEEE